MGIPTGVVVIVQFRGASTIDVVGGAGGVAKLAPIDGGIIPGAIVAGGGGKGKGTGAGIAIVVIELADGVEVANGVGVVNGIEVADGVELVNGVEVANADGVVELVELGVI
jgi:hypothetical protein